MKWIWNTRGEISLTLRDIEIGIPIRSEIPERCLWRVRPKAYNQVNRCCRRPMWRMLEVFRMFSQPVLLGISSIIAPRTPTQVSISHTREVASLKWTRRTSGDTTHKLQLLFSTRIWQRIVIHMFKRCRIDHRRIWTLFWRQTLAKLIWSLTMRRVTKISMIMALEKQVISWAPLPSMFTRISQQTAWASRKYPSSIGPSIGKVSKISCSSKGTSFPKTRSSWTSSWAKCTKMFYIQPLTRKFCILG